MIFILRDKVSGKYVSVDALRGFGLTSDLPFALRVQAPDIDAGLRYGMDALRERWGKTNVELEAIQAPETKRR